MMSAVSEMHEPRPSSPQWPTAVLPTVGAADDKYRRAGRRRLIVLGSAGAFLMLAIGYWALSGPDDEQAPVAAPVTSAQVLQTPSIEPLVESSSTATGKPPTSKPPTSKPVTRQPVTQQVRPGPVLAQMQRELGVLVRTGQLERDDARALNQRLRKIAESLRDNDLDEAADRLEDFAEKLADLHDDGDISEAGFNALAAQAAQLAAQLPAQ